MDRLGKFKDLTGNFYFTTLLVRVTREGLPRPTSLRVLKIQVSTGGDANDFFVVSWSLWSPSTLIMLPKTNATMESASINAKQSCLQFEWLSLTFFLCLILQK
jgi:hypothetical protein